MTVLELKRLCACANPTADVIVRIDSESLDSPRGPVFEVLSGEYTSECTDTYCLILDCGQPDKLRIKLE
jgi:hypothetical protein